MIIRLILQEDFNMKRNHKIISKHSLNTKHLPRRVSYAKVRASLTACHLMTTYFCKPGNQEVLEISPIDDDIIASYQTCRVINPSTKTGKSIIKAIQDYSTDLPKGNDQGILLIACGSMEKHPVGEYTIYDHAIAVVSSRKNFKHGNVYVLYCDGDWKFNPNYSVVDSMVYRPMSFRCRNVNKLDYISLPRKIE